MTNGDRGADLAAEILSTLAVTYGWRDFRPTEMTVAAVDPAGYTELAGTYRVEARGIEAVVEADGRRLYVRATGLERVELLPLSDTVYFSREDGTRFTFTREDGRVTALTAMGLRAVRVR
jgi:hypothetical protein